jgi:hypothetical protein
MFKYELQIPVDNQVRQTAAAPPKEPHADVTSLPSPLSSVRTSTKVMQSPNRIAINASQTSSSACDIPRSPGISQSMSRERDASEKRQAVVCKNFLNNQCSKGDKCPRIHPESERHSTSSTSVIKHESNAKFVGFWCVFGSLSLITTTSQASGPLAIGRTSVGDETVSSQPLSIPEVDYTGSSVRSITRLNIHGTYVAMVCWINSLPMQRGAKNCRRFAIRT